MKCLIYGFMPEVKYGPPMSIVNGAMGSAEADAEHVREAQHHDPAAGSYTVKFAAALSVRCSTNAGSLRSIFFPLMSKATRSRC